MKFNVDPAATIESQVDAIIDWARSIGVSIEINIYEDSLHIPHLARDTDDDRTKGGGALALNAVIALADLHGLALDIEHMSDEPGLAVYYARFGFTQLGEPGEITNLRRTASH